MVGTEATMLMHRCVPRTFLSTAAAGRAASFKQGLDDSGVGLRLTNQHVARRGAHIGTVEIQADAVPQISDHRLGQTGIGTGRANLTTCGHVGGDLA